MGLFREIRLELSYVIFALGIFITLLAALHYFVGDALPGASSILSFVGRWIVWFVVLGPLLTIVGGWYFVDILRKRREFETLINVHSKAHFVRDQARLEELAWYLPSEYHRRFVNRKRDWKIKG